MRSSFVVGPIGLALILITPVGSGQSQQQQTTAGSHIEARSGEPSPRVATIFDPKFGRETSATEARSA
jgi:hypothetical protein